MTDPTVPDPGPDTPTCPASVSGECLALTEGGQPCLPGECDYTPDPPGPDTPTWTTDDDRLVFTDAEGYTASLTRFGGNAALAAGFHALVADIRAARAHEHCGPATDTLRQARELAAQLDQNPMADTWSETVDRLIGLLVDGGGDG